MVKNLPANAGEADAAHELGRSPVEGNGNSLQYSLMKGPHHVYDVSICVCMCILEGSVSNFVFTQRFCKDWKRLGFLEIGKYSVFKEQSRIEVSCVFVSEVFLFF